MTDLRSGLCHGPDCAAPLTDRSASWLFCRQECQMAWHASLALPPMPSMSIHLPSPNMARWTSEGGAPVTPETSTWTPVDHETNWSHDQRVEIARLTAQIEAWQRSELGQAMQADTLDVRMDNRTGTFTPTSPMRRVPYGEEWTDVTEHVADPAPGVKVELGRRAGQPEAGEAATQSPIQEGSWLSRLQGWLRG